MSCEEAIEGELKALRRVGLRRHAEVELQTTHAVCRQVFDLPAGSSVERSHLERLLTRAIDSLGGGEVAEAAETLFGLKEGFRGLAPHRLRRAATEIFYENSSDANKEAFRKTWETERILPEIAAAVCSLEELTPPPPPLPATLDEHLDLVIECYRDLADMAVIVRHPGSRVTPNESRRWVDARTRLRGAVHGLLEASRDAMGDQSQTSVALGQAMNGITNEWLTPYDDLPALDADECRRLLRIVRTS